MRSRIGRADSVLKTESWLAEFGQTLSLSIIATLSYFPTTLDLVKGSGFSSLIVGARCGGQSASSFGIFMIDLTSSEASAKSRPPYSMTQNSQTSWTKAFRRGEL
jgi:hypothetical protein